MATKTAPEAAPVKASSFRVPDSTTAALSRPAFPTQYFRPAESLPELPKGNLPKCLELWRDLHRAWRHPKLAPEWRKFIVDLRREANALQQVPAAPVIDFQQLGRERAAAAITSGEAARQSESLELAALVANEFEGEPLIPTRPIPDALLAFVSTNGRDQAHKLRSALAAYAIKYNELFALHSPTQRAAERKIALHSNPTPEQSKRITEEAATETNPHFADLCANARNELRELWAATVKPLEAALIGAALDYVRGCKQVSVEHEAALFEDAGLPHEPTAVSKKFDALIAELERQPLTESRPTVGPRLSVMHHSQSILSRLFAVEVL